MSASMIDTHKHKAAVAARIMKWFVHARSKTTSYSPAMQTIQYFHVTDDCNDDAGEK
jgi:hypothetical protein